MKYRGVEFYAVCHEGTGRVTYICDYEQRTLRSDTQAGIRAQIGRVLNGLTPCDCDICRWRIPATPISLAGCEYSVVMEKNDNCRKCQPKVRL